MPAVGRILTAGFTRRVLLKARDILGRAGEYLPLAGSLRSGSIFPGHGLAEAQDPAHGPARGVTGFGARMPSPESDRLLQHMHGNPTAPPGGPHHGRDRRLVLHSARGIGLESLPRHSTRPRSPVVHEAETDRSIRLAPAETGSCTCAETNSMYHPGIGLIHLEPDSWGDGWRGRHSLAVDLSEYFPSVWMEPPVHWKDAVRNFRGSEIRTLLEGEGRSLTGYRPPSWLPHFYHLNVFSDFTFRMRLWRARRILRRQGCRQLVLMIWRPEFGRALDLIRHDVGCYYINDEYSFTMEETPTPSEEEALLRRADLVFIHSPGLMAKKGQYNANTFYSPNGVYYSHFAKPQAEPSDLAAVPHPRIGYVGALKQQLDWRLIETLIDRHPSYSFVFLGPTALHPVAEDAVERLSKRPNTYFLGSRPVGELAAYVQHFDVCTMPYVRVPYTQYIYPLKLHEYLAAGGAVVATPIRSLEPFADLVCLADGPDEWSAALKRCLAEGANNAERRERRREVAREHDWGRIAGRIADQVLDRLGTSGR